MTKDTVIDCPKSLRPDEEIVAKLIALRDQLYIEKRYAEVFFKINSCLYVGKYETK